MEVLLLAHTLMCPNTCMKTSQKGIASTKSVAKQRQVHSQALIRAEYTLKRKYMSVGPGPGSYRSALHHFNHLATSNPLIFCMVIAGSLPFLPLLRHYTLLHGELQISNFTTFSQLVYIASHPSIQQWL